MARSFSLVPVVRLVVLVAPVVGVAVAVWALSVAGDLQVGSVADPGIGVRVALPVAELCRNLSVAGVLGILVTMVWVVGPSDRIWSRLMDAAAAAASVWATAAAVTGLLTFISATGLAPTDPGFSGELVGYLTGIEFGRAWAIETIAAAGIAALCVAVRAHTGALVLLLATVAALLPVLSLGHSGNGGEAPVEVPALVLHVLAAGTWTGGLAVVALVAATRRDDLRPVLERYGTVGLICLAAVSLSGTTLALLHLGGAAPLATSYGLLVIAKVGLLILAGVFGGLTRLRLLRPLAPMRMRWVVAAVLTVELVVLAAAMGVAAALARTPSPESKVATGPMSTRAEALTGRPLPAPLDALHLAVTWRPDVVWIGFAVLLAVGYGAGIARIRRAGRRWPGGRVAAWFGGVAALVALTSGGVDVYGQVLLSVHLARTVLLLFLVPALLIAGAPGRLVRAAATRRTDGSRGLYEWCQALGTLPAVRWMARPLPATLLALALLALLYGTELLTWEVQQLAGHEVISVTLLVTGVLLVTGWRRIAEGRALSIALLVLGVTGIAMWMLLGGRVGAGWFAALGWPDPRSDQRDAGIVLLVLLGLGLLVAAPMQLRTRAARRPT